MKDNIAMCKLDSFVAMLWGYSPSTLTINGVSKLIIDVFTLFIVGFLFVNYPHELSQDYTIRWAGAVALLLLMMYGFFPQMTRVMRGKYYEHDMVDE